MKICTQCKKEKNIPRGLVCEACKSAKKRAIAKEKADLDGRVTTRSFAMKEAHQETEILDTADWKGPSVKEDPPEESPDEATKQAIVAFNAYDVKHPVWRSVGKNGYWVYAGRHHIGNEGLISSCLNPDCSTTLLEDEAHAMKVPGQPETPKLPIPLSL